MSSVQSSLAQVPYTPTRFVAPEGPAYTQNGVTRLFPFSYRNGVLDISLEGNSFESIMINTSQEAPGSETDTFVKVLGTTKLVTSLGENFKAYIRAWRDGTIDSGSPIELYMPCQVIRVQEVDQKYTGGNTSFYISTEAPSGDMYVNGNVDNKYFSTYLLKTPLTFTILEGGVRKYITFIGRLDQE